MRALISALCVMALCLGIPITDVAGASEKGEIVYSGKYPDKCLKNIVQENLKGVEKGYALKLTPDQWHAPILKLFCDAKNRKDFTPYSTIEFYFPEPQFQSWKPHV